MNNDDGDSQTSEIDDVESIHESQDDEDQGIPRSKISSFKLLA